MKRCRVISVLAAMLLSVVLTSCAIGSHDRLGSDASDFFASAETPAAEQEPILISGSDPSDESAVDPDIHPAINPSDESAVGSSTDPAAEPEQTGTLLGSASEDAVPFYSGPLFTYNASCNVLLAYCYESGSPELPLNLSYGAKTDGSVNQFVLPEFDLTVFYLYDTTNLVWRVFDTDPGAMSLCRSCYYTYETGAEYRVYEDTEGLLPLANQLNRYTTTLSVPGYRQYGDILHFQAAYIESAKGSYSLEFASDLDGDGTLDELLAIPYFSAANPDQISGHKISINTESVLDLDTAAGWICGIDIIDIDETDSFKEIVMKVKSGSDTCSVFILRYDGASVKAERFDTFIDLSDNHSLLVGQGDFIQPAAAVIKYQVDKDFVFTRVDQIINTNIEVTVTAPIKVQFLENEVYIDGVLKAGNVIQIKRIDSVSKAYFLTADNREGILLVNGLLLGPDELPIQDCLNGLI